MYAVEKAISSPISSPLRSVGGLDYSMWNGPNDGAVNFVTGQYRKGGVLITPAALGFGSVHATNILALDAAGAYDVAGPNVIPRNNLGHQRVPTGKNELLQANFASYWSLVRITRVPNAILAPDGTITAASSAASIDNNSHRIQQSFLTTNLQTYTYYYFAKPANKTFAYITTEDFLAVNTTYFNLGNGTIGTVGANHSNVTIQKRANGFYMLAVTFVGNASGGWFNAAFANGDMDPVWAGDGVTVDGYLWGAKHALGSFATPPIITTGTALTRDGNQDTFSGLSLNTGLEFAIVADIKEPGSDFKRILQFDDGSNNNRISLSYNAGNILLDVLSGGVSQASLNLGPWQQGMIGISGSVGTNFAHAEISGGAVVAPDTTAIYPTMTKASPGGTSFNVTENAFIRTSEMYWRTDVTPSTLRAAELSRFVAQRKAIYA